MALSSLCGLRRLRVTILEESLEIYRQRVTNPSAPTRRATLLPLNSLWANMTWPLRICRQPTTTTAHTVSRPGRKYRPVALLEDLGRMPDLHGAARVHECATVTIYSRLW